MEVCHSFAAGSARRRGGALLDDDAYDESPAKRAGHAWCDPRAPPASPDGGFGAVMPPSSEKAAALALEHIARVDTAAYAQQRQRMQGVCMRMYAESLRYSFQMDQRYTSVYLRLRACFIDVPSNVPGGDCICTTQPLAELAFLTDTLETMLQSGIFHKSDFFGDMMQYLPGKIEQKIREADARLQEMGTDLIFLNDFMTNVDCSNMFVASL